jgi:hypothetical protein
MKTTLGICCISLLLGGAALAQDKAAPPAGAPDMSKMGPLSRPVTKEKEAKKGIDELYKAVDEAFKKGDVTAAADNVDFPVLMLSDDSKGVEQHFEASREQWLGFMKGFVESRPKDLKMSHKHTVTLLSDTLGLVTEDNSVSTGSVKGKYKGFAVVNYKDGKWKFKQMAEAGWGDTKPPAGAASAKK